MNRFDYVRPATVRDAVAAAAEPGAAYLAAVGACREREAGIDALAVDEHRAGAALAAIAAFLGAGQVQAFAQQIEEGDTRVIKLDSSGNAVDGKSR